MYAVGELTPLETEIVTKRFKRPIDPSDENWKKLRFNRDVPMFRQMKTQLDDIYAAVYIGEKTIDVIFPQCSGITKKGHACKNKVSPFYPFTYCHVHKPTPEPKPVQVPVIRTAKRKTYKKKNKFNHKFTKFQVKQCREWKEHGSCFRYGSCFFLHKGMGVYGLVGDTEEEKLEKRKAMIKHLKTLKT
jgi:hypothetical protein